MVAVQSLSHAWLFSTPWTEAHHASLFFTTSWSLLKLMSTESVMPSNHLILCCPLFLPPSIFPSIRVFSVNQLFTSGGQSIGVSASASVPPMNIQGWFPLGLTGLISLQSKGLSRVFSNTTVQKHQFFSTQPLRGPALISIHDYWKNHSSDYTDLSWQNNSNCNWPYLSVKMVIKTFIVKDSLQPLCLLFPISKTRVPPCSQDRLEN